MLKEIDNATRFILKMMKVRCSTTDADDFGVCLAKVLRHHYTSHWHPEKPNKGSGYRCIRIVTNDNIIDPVLRKAARMSGLTEKKLKETLPPELTMWVDPNAVCYRFGEEGSIDYLYRTTSSPTTSSSDSDSSDAERSSSRSPSPVHRKPTAVWDPFTRVHEQSRIRNVQNFHHYYPHPVMVES